MPSVGLSIALVWTVAGWIDDRPGRRTIAIAGTIAALVALSVVAFRQTAYWKDSQTLFQHALAVTKNNYTIENNLGVVLARAGKSDEAIALYRKRRAHIPIMRLRIRTWGTNC